MTNKLKKTLRTTYYKSIENNKIRKTLKSLQMYIKNDNDLILVHQMGRAASMTITSTLRAMELEQPVYHTHWLNKQSVKERVARINSWKNNGAGPLNVRVSELLSPEIENRLHDRKWNIVSIFREPVARNVSAFFLDIERFFPDFFNQYSNNKLSLNKITEVFLEEFPHEMPLDWFDVEIKSPFGIDVFETEYDDQKGYMCLKQENVSLLAIKLENLNSCFHDAFFEFFGKSPASLVNTHVTDEDKNFSMYKDFLREVELPDSYLERMYDCKYVKHFYSSDEIQNFRKKWSNKH